MLIVTVTYLYNYLSNTIFPGTCTQKYCLLVQSYYPSKRRTVIKTRDGISTKKNFAPVNDMLLTFFLINFLALFYEKITLQPEGK